MNADGSPGELLVPGGRRRCATAAEHWPAALPGAAWVTCLPRTPGTMAVWSDRPTTERVFLGENVEQIDVWGRARSAACASRTANRCTSW
jgi:hypothetical protein